MREMTYNEGRNEIQDGDIVFIRNKRSIPALIVRFFTRSDYSHVGFAFWATVAGERRLFMAEAQGGARRRIVNMSFYKDDTLDVVRAPVPWNTIVSSALDRLGSVHYGWLEAIYVGLREFLLKYTKFIRLPTFNLPGEICSEYVASLIGMEEIHVSPQLLIEQLNEQGHEVDLRIKPQ